MLEGTRFSLIRISRIRRAVASSSTEIKPFAESAFTFSWESLSRILERATSSVTGALNNLTVVGLEDSRTVATITTITITIMIHI